MGRDVPASNNGQPTNSGGTWRLVRRGLRVSRAMAVVLVLAASLAANAALFVGGVLFNVIDEAVESVTGLATATGKQRKLTDGLKRENRRLVASNRSLQNRMTRLRKETNDAVKRTMERSVNAAKRVVITAPGKALPYLGTAVVVGAAAWEIKDLCGTVRDMKEIQRAIDPSESRSEDERRICGMDPPTREEILSQIETAPLDAWRRSRSFLADLDPIPPEFETRFNRWWNDKGPFRDGVPDWLSNPNPFGDAERAVLEKLMAAGETAWKGLIDEARQGMGAAKDAGVSALDRLQRQTQGAHSPMQ